MRILTLTALLAAGAAVAVAQRSPSTLPNPTGAVGWVQGATTLEQAARYNALMDANVRPLNLDEKQILADRSLQREQDCLRAFGDKAFCECLKKESPAVASFTDYVNVVTHSKEELGYDKLSKDVKTVVDSLLKAREVCVAQRQAQK